MRILVTGGAGFIGSHLVDRLLIEDHQVVVVDNLITGDIQNITHLLGRNDFEFFKHDVSNFIFVPGEIDAVMHLASPASPDPASPFGYPQLPIQTLKVGALGTHNALGVARVQKRVADAETGLWDALSKAQRFIELDEDETKSAD